MKKRLNYFGLLRPNSNCHKLLLTIKISAFLLFCCLVNIFAGPAYSQVTRISLNFRNTAIEEVLNKIEDESEFYFLYNQKLIDVTRKVDIEAENEPIGDILAGILNNDVKYVVYDREIIISPNTLTIPNSEPQQNIIKGKITDENGAPLPGVNIKVEGTTLGSISDVSGN